MSIETIALLIIRFGVPAAEAIYNVLAKHGAPTPTMWAELKALNLKTADDYFGPHPTASKDPTDATV